MRKTIQRMWVLGIMLIVSNTAANAHDFEVDGIYYDITSETDMTVGVTYKGSYNSSYSNEYTGSVVIPETVVFRGLTYSVTSIGNMAFDDCSRLTSVTIGNSVTSIGNDAFSDCIWLTSATIGNSVTSIGNDAFESCTKLTSIIIPESVISIGNRAFEYCTGLTSVTIGNSVTSIGEYAFHVCSKLTNVTIGNFVTGIGNHAFASCTKLTSIIIPDSVISIGSHAFYDCKSLTSVTIGNSVTSIGDYTFFACSSLTSITIPESMTSIGNSAFSSCTNLTSVTIPNSVTSIGSDAFSYCHSLKSVTIPKSVTSIGSHAFYYCNGLESIVVEEGNVTYDSRENSNAIIETSSHTLMTGCKYTVIPNTVTNIGDGAFSYCISLRSITIPKSVMSIGGDAFIECRNLKTVINLSSLSISKGSSSHGYVACYAQKVIDADEQVGDFYFKTEEGVHYLVGYIGTDSEITLPENYKGESYEIGDNAFAYCTNLRSITIPNFVTSIGNYAFYNCSQLTSIVVEEGNTVFESRDGNHAIVRKSDGYIVFSIARYIAIECISRTLTTLTFQIFYEEDDNFESCGINYGYKDYKANSEGIVTIPNLNPNETVTISIYSYYDKVRRDRLPTVCQYTTKDINVNLTKIEERSGATTLCVQGLYDIGDATLKASGFTEPSSIESNIILLTGLEPNSTITVSYYVTVEEGNYTKTVTETITTPSLTLTTLPAKATSNTKAVICAETNIANEETGTGFEFRRIDAPDLVPSTVVYCAVHDGVMEGILNNLSANTYYKYRPFYKSAAGNMYYGDWIGFGTADAYVYFTPTVHTYATATVENNTATLNGYALAGSDDIVEQGFEYWADGTTHTRATGEVMTVTATGQRMSITLNNLQYNTTYKYRAYVKTAKETTYGEEMSFSTGDDPTGIGEVSAEGFSVEVRTVQGNIEVRLTGESTVTRYTLYTLNGVLVDNGAVTPGATWQRIGSHTLSKGLYVLRVENGKQCRTVKVMVK